MRAGKFEYANGGTLFLDEVADLPKHMQAMLLRVLDTHSFDRFGTNVQVHSDFRLVAATNCDLANMVKKGKFRRDLYFRLTVVTIRVPPLRDHREDIPELVEHFIRKHRPQDAHRLRVTSRDMDRLHRYEWPGNVRELSNAVERARANPNGELDFGDFEFPDQGEASTRTGLVAGSYSPMTDRENRLRHARATLEHTGGIVRKAAAILNLHPTTLTRLLRSENEAS
jgi:DNA-binding NtrC family response regulator